MLKLKSFVSFWIVLSLSSILLAQSGPTWRVLGNLQDAQKVWAFLEIPGTDIVLAGGRAYSNYAAVWKSTDRGNSWTRKFCQRYSSEGIKQFAFDEDKNIIFAGIAENDGSYIEWNSLVRSNDMGETWTFIPHPVSLGNRAEAHSIILLNDKLYVAFNDKHTENGNSSYWSIYSAELYRLDVSDPNPDNWYWEFVMQYPELDYLMRLTEKDGKIYVFGKDKATDGIRFFVYDPETMDKTATKVGTIRDIKKQIQQIKQQQTAFKGQDTHNSTPTLNKGRVIR